MKNYTYTPLPSFTFTAKQKHIKDDNAQAYSRTKPTLVDFVRADSYECNKKQTSTNC